MPTHPEAILNIVPSVNIKGKWWQLCLMKASLVIFFRLNIVYEILNVCSFVCPKDFQFCVETEAFLTFNISVR